MLQPGAYIPIDRRIALANDTTLPDHDEGAVLFADISGFTNLTDILLKEAGPRKGSEELMLQINAVYTALIGDVNRYRGSVIGFSGDAIMCWFGSHLALHVNPGLQAVSCAILMQETMEIFRNVALSSGTKISLDIKIVVCAGQVRRFIVGEPDIQLIDVIAGSPLDRITSSSAVLERGDVLIDEVLYQQSKNDLRISGSKKAREDQFYKVEKCLVQMETQSWQETHSMNLQVKNEEQWLIPEVNEILRDSRDTFMAEFREAVSVFLKFGGLDFARDQRAPKKLDVFIRKVQHVLRQYGGSLIQLTTGDKGSYLYAAFGAPIALANSPFRAVSAAIELVNISRKYEFVEDVHIGIAMGLMRVGAYGSPIRATYGVIGRETNVAARLMAVAPDETVLVTKELVDATKSSFVYVPYIAEELPGLLKSRLIFQAVERVKLNLGGEGDPDQENFDRIMLLNREMELGVIHFHLGALNEQNKGGVIVMEGEDGIGKSPLLREIAATAKKKGLLQVTSSGDPLKTSVSYGLWRGIVAGIIGFSIDDPQGAQKLEEYFQTKPELRSYAPLLNPILPFVLDESRETMRLLGDKRAQAFRKFLEHVLESAFKESPAVVILDNITHADQRSWELLEKMVGRKLPVLYILGLTPFVGQLPEAYQRILQQKEVKLLRIRPFDFDQTSLMIRKVLDLEYIPEKISQYIYHKTKGHPEYTYDLVQGNIQWIKEAVASTADYNLKEKIKIPDLVIEKISTHLDRLSPQYQLTLKIASVIGVEFDIELLASVFPGQGSDENLRRQLQELVRLGFLIPDVEYPARIRFKYPIIQEIVYNRLLYNQRRKLHQEIARWYESHPPQEPQGYFKLAYHFQQVGDIPEYEKYLEIAADLSFVNGDFPTVIQDYKSLVGQEFQAQEPITQSKRLRQIGYSYYGMGRLKEASKPVDEALRILNQAALKTHPRQRLTFLDTLQQKTPFLNKLQWREIHPGDVDEKLAMELVQVFLLQGEIKANALETEAFLMNSFQGLKFARRTHHADTIAAASIQNAYTLRLLGEAVESDELLRLTLEQREDCSPRIRIYIDHWAALISMSKGEWLQAERAITQAVMEAGNGQDPIRNAEVLGNLGWFFMFQGWMDASQATFRRLYDQSAQRGMSFYSANGLTGLYLCAVRSGYWDRALEIGQRTHELLGWLPGHLIKVLNDGLNAIVASRLGDMKRAVQYSDSLYERLGGTQPANVILVEAYAGMLEAFLAQKSWMNKQRTPTGTLDKKIQASLEAFKGGNQAFLIWEPRWDYYSGVFEKELGNLVKAENHWQKCLSNSSKFNLPWEQGLAHLQLGQFASNVQVRFDHLTQARGIFKKLNANHESEITIQLIEKSNNR